VSDTSGAGATPPAGTVSPFTTDGTGTFSPGTSCTLAPATSSTSTCSVSYTPTVRGTAIHNIGATYSGTNPHNPSTSSNFALIVNKANTTTTVVDSADPTVVGENYTISVTVAPIAPGGGTPTGTVSISYGEGSCSPALVSGSASCVVANVTPGPKTLTATYLGDSNFNGSSDTEPHQVNNPRWHGAGR
jgi:hypothetical protein